MMTKGGRIATAQGAMLADPDLIGNSLLPAGAALFDPAFWAARAQLQPTAAGRGASWFIGSGAQSWVLRHYRRGGFMSHLSRDRYWFASERSVRAFAEWRLLDTMQREGLPVPKPVAAAYRRNGFTYRCDLITERIPAVRPLSALLSERRVATERWRCIGATIARLHAALIDHADLNAHNLLCGEDVASLHIIDFDRSRQRAHRGYWQDANLTRLKRSVHKVAPPGHFSDADWQALLAGYG